MTSHIIHFIDDLELDFNLSGANCLPASKIKSVTSEDVQKVISFINSEIAHQDFSGENELFYSYMQVFSCLKDLQRLKS